MEMTEFWFRIDLTKIPCGVIVVEATEASRGLWKSLAKSILEGCAESLPRERWPQVVFLGDSISHPLDAVLRGLGSRIELGPGPAVEIEAELGRGPWIGPWLSQCGPSHPLMVLALFQAKILDLPDWTVPEVTQSTLAYRLTGTERLTASEWTEVSALECEFSVVPAHLAPPLNRIELGWDSGIPLRWDPDCLELSGRVISGSAPADSFHVGFLSDSEPKPQARGRRTNNSWIDLRVDRIERVDPSAPCEPDTLLGGEISVLENWASINSSPYYCKTCHPKRHAIGEVRCQTSEKPALFPTLARYSAGTLCELEKRAMDWRVHPVIHGTAILEDGSVLVVRSSGQLPVIYRKLRGVWEPTPPSGERFWKSSTGGFLVIT